MPKLAAYLPLNRVGFTKKSKKKPQYEQTREAICQRFRYTQDREDHECSNVDTIPTEHGDSGYDQFLLLYWDNIERLTRSKVKIS